MSSQVWEIKQVNWLKVNKDLEELSYIGDLNYLSGVLLIQGDTHKFSSLLGVDHCFASALDK